MLISLSSKTSITTPSWISILCCQQSQPTADLSFTKSCPNMLFFVGLFITGAEGFNFDNRCVSVESFKCRCSGLLKPFTSLGRTCQGIHEQIGKTCHSPSGSFSGRQKRGEPDRRCGDCSASCAVQTGENDEREC